MTPGSSVGAFGSTQPLELDEDENVGDEELWELNIVGPSSSSLSLLAIKSVTPVNSPFHVKSCDDVSEGVRPGVRDPGQRSTGSFGRDQQLPNPGVTLSAS